jgi:hypothetical protein
MLTTKKTIASAAAYGEYTRCAIALSNAVTALDAAIRDIPGDDFDGPEEAARFARARQKLLELPAATFEVALLAMPPEDAERAVEQLARGGN